MRLTRLLGNDPEILVVNGNNQIVPASLFLTQPASTPHELAPIAYDNAAIEIRPAPAYCQIAYVGTVRENLWQAISQMRLARRQGRIPAGSQITLAPLAKLHPTTAMKHSEILSQFGCSPSMALAPSGEIIPSTPTPEMAGLFRSAGAHIHVGIDTYNTYSPAGFKKFQSTELPTTLRLLDTFLGLTDVVMNHHYGWDIQARMRRQRLGYGVPGEHRLKTYPDGSATVLERLEYRTMSPWLLSSPAWVWWANTSTRFICQLDSYGWTKQALNILPPYAKVHAAIMKQDAASAYAMLATLLPQWAKLSRGYGLSDGGHVGILGRSLNVMSRAIHSGNHIVTAGKSVEYNWFNGFKEPLSTSARHRYARQRKVRGSRIYFNNYCNTNHESGLRRDMSRVARTHDIDDIPDFKHFSLPR